MHPPRTCNIWIFVNLLYVLIVMLALVPGSSSANTIIQLPYTLQTNGHLILKTDKNGIAELKGTAVPCQKIRNNRFVIYRFNKKFHTHYQIGTNWCKPLFEDLRHAVSMTAVEQKNADANHTPFNDKLGVLTRYYTLNAQAQYLVIQYQAIVDKETQRKQQALLLANQQLQKKLEQQRQTQIRACNHQYRQILHNDRSGIELINQSLADHGTLAYLQSVRNYSFLVLKANGICLRQSRYQRLKTAVLTAIGSLSDAINQAIQEKRAQRLKSRAGDWHRLTQTNQ